MRARAAALWGLAGLLAVAAAALAGGEGPQAEAGVASIDTAVNLEVEFSALGSAPGAGHSALSFLWNFADPDCDDTAPIEAVRACDSELAVASHAFATAGVYVVQLLVTDEHGASDMDFVTVNVEATDAAPVISEPEGGWAQAGAIGEGIDVFALVEDYIGVTDVNVHYAVDANNDGVLDGDDDEGVAAMSDGDGDGTYEATIPGDAVDNPVVGYYIEAQDASDNTVRYPESGQDADDGTAGIENGYLLVRFGLGITGVSSGTVGLDLVEGVVVEATIAPVSDVESALLKYRALGDPSYATVAMENPCGTLWTGAVPVGAFLDGDTLQFYIEVFDGDTTVRNPAVAYTTDPNEVELDVDTDLPVAACLDDGDEDGDGDGEEGEGPNPSGGGGGGGGGSKAKETQTGETVSEEEGDTPEEDDGEPLADADADLVGKANEALARSLRVVRTAGGNALSWDDAEGEAGYQVWASDSPWRLVGELPAGATAFTDPGGKATTKYLVTAFYRDAEGNLVGHSDDINEDPVPGQANLVAAGTKEAGRGGEGEAEPKRSGSRLLLLLVGLAVVVALALAFAMRRGGKDGK